VREADSAPWGDGEEAAAGHEKWDFEDFPLILPVPGLAM